MDMRFAYWVPNVSGGLVVSKIPHDLPAFGRSVIPVVRQIEARRRTSAQALVA